jgi:hypothetical protein
MPEITPERFADVQKKFIDAAKLLHFAAHDKAPITKIQDSWDNCSWQVCKDAREEEANLKSGRECGFYWVKFDDDEWTIIGLDKEGFDFMGSDLTGEVAKVVLWGPKIEPPD